MCGAVAVSLEILDIDSARDALINQGKSTVANN
jgi:hypothetical protein